MIVLRVLWCVKRPSLYVFGVWMEWMELMLLFLVKAELSWVMSKMVILIKMSEAMSQDVPSSPMIDMTNHGEYIRVMMESAYMYI